MQLHLLRQMQVHVFHRLEDQFHPLCDVAKYELSVELEFLRGEVDVVDEAHLLMRKQVSKDNELV